MIRAALTIIGDIIGVAALFGMGWMGFVAIYALGG